MNSRKSVGVAVWAAVAIGAAGACALTGCAGKTTGITLIDRSAERQGEARRLAAEGQAAQEAGKSDLAIDLYRQSLAQTRELGFVQNNLALLLMDRGNYMEAVALFQEAADAMLESAKPLYNIGLAYSKRGHEEKAMGYFEQALARQPYDGDSLRAVVRAQKLLNRSDDASLARVRRALMIETEPRWRRLEESEQFRIEYAIAEAKENMPMEVLPDMPGEMMGHVVGTPLDPNPVPAPGPVVPSRGAGQPSSPLPESSPAMINPPPAAAPGGMPPAPQNPAPVLPPAPTPAPAPTQPPTGAPGLGGE